MIKLKDLLLEDVLLDFAAAQKLVEVLRREINAPFVEATVSTLGGRERPSVMLRVSLDPKSEWTNGIFHNSRYSMWSIQYDGTLEQFNMGHRIPRSSKFRKTRFKTPNDVINKINAYIQKIQ